MTGKGGENTRLFSIAPVADVGFVVVGVHNAENGVAKGNKVPTAAIPPWGKDSPSGESALLGFFRSDSDREGHHGSAGPAQPQRVRGASLASRRTVRPRDPAGLDLSTLQAFARTGRSCSLVARGSALARDDFAIEVPGLLRY